MEMAGNICRGRGRVSTQEEKAVWRPEEEKKSYMVREAKEISMARVRHIFISCVEIVAIFWLYKLTSCSPYFSFEHVFSELFKCPKNESLFQTSN